MKTHLSKQRGVGIVEALVSLLILAVSAIALLALQVRLRQGSDIAKWRTEAVRIAEEDLERFRAFGTIASDGMVANNFAYESVSAAAPSTEVTVGGVATKTNATFTLARTLLDAPRVTGVSDAPMKNLAVTVSWVDRASATQAVTLRTVLSRSDPALAAALAYVPNRGPVRGVIGRHAQVPLRAKQLGDGTSAFMPLAGGTVAYVFSDASGRVTKKCAGLASMVVTANLTTEILSGAGVTCTEVNAYLVSGVVRASLSDSPQATDPNDPAPGALAMRVDFDNTRLPANAIGSQNQLASAHWPSVDGAGGTTIGTGAVTYTPAECSTEALQMVRYTTPVGFAQVNDGNATTVTSTIVTATIPQDIAPITPANVAPWVGVSAVDASSKVIGPQATGEKFVGYACAIYPIDLDLDGKTAAAYSARVTVWPTAGWILGTGIGSFKVCRYSADRDRSGSVHVVVGNDVTGIDNQEHPYAYLNSQESLGNQNFLVIPGQRPCPSAGAVEVDGRHGANYTGGSTVTHQP